MFRPQDIVALALTSIILVFLGLATIITYNRIPVDQVSLGMWKDLLLTLSGGLVGYISGGGNSAGPPK